MSITIDDEKQLRVVHELFKQVITKRLEELGYKGERRIRNDEMY